MVIWSGLGILTVVIGFAGIMCSHWLFGNSHIADSIFLFLAAVANWFLGVKLNSSQSRVYRDESTGELVHLKRNHTLFWVPMQWWSVAFVIGSLMLLLK